MEENMSCTSFWCAHRHISPEMISKSGIQTLIRGEGLQPTGSSQAKTKLYCEKMNKRSEIARSGWRWGLVKASRPFLYYKTNMLRSHMLRHIRKSRCCPTITHDIELHRENTQMAGNKLVDSGCHLPWWWSIPGLENKTTNPPPQNKKTDILKQLTPSQLSLPSMLHCRLLQAAPASRPDHGLQTFSGPQRSWWREQTCCTFYALMIPNGLNAHAQPSTAFKRAFQQKYCHFYISSQLL